MHGSKEQEQPFANRHDAGEYLASKLVRYANRDDIMVLALPRGGMPVAYEIARKLNAPLDIFIVRKLGVPHHEELAMGAIASGGVRVLNDDVIRRLKIAPEMIDVAAEAAERELDRREFEYRRNREPLNVRGKIVILADDGLATGASMRAGVRALKQLDPSKIIVAVPVGAPDICREIAKEVDEVVCGKMPQDFTAVGAWYLDFRQTTDHEVCELLNQLARDGAGTTSGGGPTRRSAPGDSRENW